MTAAKAKAPAQAGATAAPALLRPSQLPKLAACRCFKDKPGEAGPAAQRGTMLDAVIRLAVNNGGDVTRAAGAKRAELTSDDRAAVEWAVRTVFELSKGAKIVTDEYYLQADPGIEGIKPGTMDTCIPEIQLLIDYKSGQMRPYDEQMAAYALACMKAYFATSWTTALLFIDQKKVVYRTFTETEAEAICKAIVDAPVTPTVCDYCGWCADCDSCPLRLQMVEEARKATEGLTKLTDKDITAIKENPDSNALVAQITADPETAAEWCRRADVVASYASAIKAIMRDRVAATAEKRLGPWSIGKASVVKAVPPNVVGHYIQQIGFGEILARLGNMKVADFEELWAKTFSSKEPPRHEYVDVQTRSGNLTIKKK